MKNKLSKGIEIVGFFVLLFWFLSLPEWSLLKISLIALMGLLIFDVISKNGK